jgi:hypothetical protein
MPDDDLLPVEVLTELGRVTWAAILLEDYTEDLCSSIDPVDPRRDKRPISRKINDAKKVLADWPVSKVRDEAIAWLERASNAIEGRNAAFHATPLVWVGGSDDGQLFLGEMPRANRLYAERPLTVGSLSTLRFVLENASSEWADIHVAVATESRRQRHALSLPDATVKGVI